MTAYTTIGSTLPKHTLHGVRFQTEGLEHATPGQTLRYLAFRAAGYSTAEAQAKVFQDVKSSWGDRNALERVSVPREIVDAIREAYPGKPVAWALRYIAALEMFGDVEAAKDIADSVQPYHGGRPRGIKETKPRRPRRTKDPTMTT